MCSTIKYILHYLTFSYYWNQSNIVWFLVKSHQVNRRVWKFCPLFCFILVDVQLEPSLNLSYAMGFSFQSFRFCSFFIGFTERMETFIIHGCWYEIDYGEFSNQINNEYMRSNHRVVCFHFESLDVLHSFSMHYEHGARNTFVESMKATEKNCENEHMSWWTVFSSLRSMASSSSWLHYDQFAIYLSIYLSIYERINCSTDSTVKVICFIFLFWRESLGKSSLSFFLFALPLYD